MKTIIEAGERYHLSGDIENGTIISREVVTRKVTRVTDTHVICECGRKFLRNENLKIELSNRQHGQTL